MQSTRVFCSVAKLRLQIDENRESIMQVILVSPLSLFLKLVTGTYLKRDPSHQELAFGVLKKVDLHDPLHHRHLLDCSVLQEERTVLSPIRVELLEPIRCIIKKRCLVKTTTTTSHKPHVHDNEARSYGYSQTMLIGLQPKRICVKRSDMCRKYITRPGYMSS